MSLVLLLCEHAAECSASCHFADRFDTDIPKMIRAVADDRFDEAIAVPTRYDGEVWPAEGPAAACGSKRTAIPFRAVG